MAHEPASDNRSFPTTGRIWPLVELARRQDGDAARKALGQLLTRYLPPLKAHLVLHKRIDPDRADDLLQGFVAGKVCADGLMAQADLARGRFRTFLLAALDHYVISALRHDKAKKRGPAKAPLAIDDHVDAVESNDQPSKAFDVAWARQVIEQVIARMRSECQAAGRNDVWGVFEQRILLPLLEGAAPMAYDELVKRYALESPAQAGNVLITGKRMFRRLLEAIVGEYARDDDEVEAEIRDLTEILSSARG